MSELSLTLPRPGTRARRRFRKPRRPSWLEVVYLLCAAINIFLAVADLRAGRPFHSGWCAGIACLFWRNYHAVRQGTMPIILSWAALLVVAGLGFFLDAIGVQ